VEGVCDWNGVGPVRISLFIFDEDGGMAPVYIAWNAVSHLVVEEISSTLSLST